MTNEHSASESSLDRDFSLRVEPKSSESALLPKQEGAVAWRDPSEIPTIRTGCMDEFILAVRSEKTGKVNTFAAHYLNKYPVEMDSTPCAACDNSCENGDGCPLTGWYTLVGDDRYDAGCFYKLDLREGRTLVAWAAMPLYATPPSLPLGEVVQKNAQTTKPSPSSTSATASENAEDEAYELGKRDGYEEAVQDIDLATGGDGEFRGSALPGGTVDVPTMKARIISRICDAQSYADLRASGGIFPEAYVSRTDESGWLIEKYGPPVYYFVTSGDYDDHWTRDAGSALRFARQEDARAYVDHIGWTSPPVRVVEHMWPPLPETDAVAPGDAGGGV